MKVSILIPAYNSSKYIEQTLASALSQSHNDCEIIVVDDGSEDNTGELVKSYIDKGHNIKLYDQENLGACAARNRAFRESSGDYILFLDADDVLSQNKVSAQLKFFERYGRDILVSSQWGRFKKEIEDAVFPVRYLDKDWTKPVEWLINAWEGKGMAQTSVWLTPRHLIERAGMWNEELLVNQDGEFFSRVILQASGIKFCKEAKIYYRSENDKSVSKVTTEDKAKSLLLSYQLYKQNALTHEDSPRVRYALVCNFMNFIYQFNGRYPMLAQLAWEEINSINTTKLPLVGGRYFKIISGLIGFGNTLALRKTLFKY